jgi:hypothetical protein
VRSQGEATTKHTKSTKGTSRMISLRSRCLFFLGELSLAIEYRKRASCSPLEKKHFDRRLDARDALRALRVPSWSLPSNLDRCRRSLEELRKTWIRSERIE